MTDPATSIPRHLVVIPAAGSGSRFSKSSLDAGLGPKQYALLAGKPVLEHTVRAFLEFEPVSAVLVVVSPGDSNVETSLTGLSGHRNWHKLVVKDCGGGSRQASVENGLAFLLASELGGTNDWAWVHDAARPGLSQSSLQALLNAIVSLEVQQAGAILARPVADTVKRQRSDSLEIDATVSREGLWLAQTPQVFRLQALHKALLEAKLASYPVTDEASAMERVGASVKLVEGEIKNNKITVAADLQWLEAVWK